MVDFSLNTLQLLLYTCIQSGYAIYRLDEYWRDRQVIDDQEKVVLLRHDVDRLPATALKMAQMEARLNICGTYFFRNKSTSFDNKVIGQISALGHEIGYHYETLADANGDYAKAADLFAQGLERLRAIAPVVSAAMHSRAFSKWDNRLLWDKYSMAQFGILGECYRSLDHSQYLYLADSGRNWNADRLVVWDKVEGLKPPEIRHGTLELVSLIESKQLSKIHLLVHPNRWRADMLGWFDQYVQDSSINLLKRAILLVKSH